jgi:hypothetical protein
MTPSREVSSRKHTIDSLTSDFFRAVSFSEVNKPAVGLFLLPSFRYARWVGLVCLPVLSVIFGSASALLWLLGWGDGCGEINTIAAGDAQFITSIDQCQI